MVVVSGGASCAEAFEPPIRLAAITDESAASTWRRLCVGCMILSSQPGRLPDEIVDGPPRNPRTIPQSKSQLLFSDCLFADGTSAADKPAGVRRIPPAVMR
jgi:hypothetical protein